MHWRFDAVARLGQAQLLGVTGGPDLMESLTESLFVSPGPLWWVFDWKGAEAQYQEARVKGARPRRPKSEWEWEPKQGTVLLIDEIDKADPDLPKGLLESLGNGELAVPHLQQSISCSRENEAPPGCWSKPVRPRARTSWCGRARPSTWISCERCWTWPGRMPRARTRS